MSNSAHLPVWALTLSVQIYNVLLLAYPQAFREEYGDELRQVFAETVREELHTHGWSGVVRLWLRILPDLVGSSLGEQWSMLEQDVRYGLRGLIKSPGFTAVTLSTLALGVGANTLIFSMVNAVLLRPLPHPAPEQLVSLQSHLQGENTRRAVFYPDLEDWRRQARGFSRLAAWRFTSLNLTGHSQPERISALEATADLLPLLGVSTQVGRTFLPDEETPGRNRVVLLSHQYWQERFGGDPSLIGSVLTLDNRSYTVVGVLPAALRFQNEEPQVWIPLSLTAKERTREMASLQVLGRLKQGFSLTLAQAEMNIIAARLARQYPQSNARREVQVIPLQEELVHNVRPALLMLFGAVGGVLVIACVNVSNMLLARMAMRRREIAVRLALGASRNRLVRQLLTESLLLAGLGGGLGLCLAAGGILALRSAAWELPQAQEIGLDPWVLGFTAALVLAAGIGFGLAPAMQASRLGFNSQLKVAGGRVSEGLSSARLRSLLVEAEVALSLVLLIATGLMLQSFARLLRVDLGFNPKQLLTAQISLPQERYAQPRRRIDFYRELRDRAAVLPGVQSASLVNNLPFSGWRSYAGFAIEGRPLRGPGDRLGAYRFDVDPGYFETMGMSLRTGRGFAPWRDERTPREVILNETAVRLFFPGQNPLGQRLRFNDLSTDWMQVVGVVGDSRPQALDEPPEPELFVPYQQSPDPDASMFMVIRSTPGIAPASLVRELRATVESIDSDQPLADLRTMEDRIAESVAQPRLTALLLALFAGVALLLATVGIYGVISYTVAQRTHELGIRLALGARSGHILALIIGQAMRPIGGGVLVGVLSAFVTSRALSSLLYGVSAADPLTFVVVPASMIAVALLASYLPARRATRIAPGITLRYE
jgi:putative ABC transport system permease protein